MHRIDLIFIKLLIIIGAASSLLSAQEGTVLKVTTWNVSWLSCSGYSPYDTELQIKNVAAVIKALDADLVALQEVGTSNSYATIDTIVKLLGSEWSGNIAPWSYSSCAQNQGIVFKKSSMELLNSSLLNSGVSSQGNTYRYNWSNGRYPALYNMNVLAGDEKIPVSFVNIHAKAYSDETSYVRRKGASEGLKTILDSPNYNTKMIILLGDFNDYLNGTQCYNCSGSPYFSESPYKNFIDDVYNYMGLTASLSDPAYNNNPVIDNIVISNELFENYEAGSAFRETAVTQQIPNFKTTTSDHTPISAQFIIAYESTSLTDTAELHMYPNPTNGKFTISFGTYVSNETVAIYTLTGVLVHVVEIPHAVTELEIDLAGVPNGYYILKTGDKTAKIVKH